MSIFINKKDEIVNTDSLDGDNPYLFARRIWNEHEGELKSSRTIWQITAILSLIIALSCVSGLIWQSQRSKIVPYVVAVDKLGEAAAVGRADQAAPADKRVIRSTLAAFITDMRSVTPDAEVKRSAIFRAFGHMNPEDPATNKATEYFSNPQTSPFKRAANETAYVEIESILPQSNESWLVDWIEETRDRQGSLIGKQRMRGLLTIYIAPPTSETHEEQILRNPLGIYVKDFSFVKHM